MLAFLQDIYWFFFALPADEWSREKGKNKTAAGFTRWAETDYFSHPGRKKRHTFKGGQRIAQPWE